MDAVRELPQLGHRLAELRLGFVEARKLRSCSGPSRLRTRRSASESPTRRCWAPSWRSRSSRRRSASPASMMRAREERRSSSWARASAWRRSFSSARRAADATSSTSSGLSRRSARWTRSATGRPSRTSGVTARPSERSGVDRPPARVRVAALADRVGDLELRVGQSLGEPVPQAAGGSRLAQLDDQPRKGRARPPGPKQAPGDGSREGRERSGLAEPQPALELAAPDEPAVEARGERARHEAEVGAAGEDDRRDDSPSRPARARHSPGGHCHQQEGPGKAKMDAEDIEVVHEPRVVGDEQEIVRATDAAESRRVVEERRQETQHEHGTGEGNGDGDALHPETETAARVGEHRPRRKRRTRREEDQADREGCGRADAGVVPLGKEPGAARRRRGAGRRRSPGRLPQKTRPQESSAQPAPSRATAPASDEPAKEKAGSSRARASETAPSASPTGQSTSRSSMCESSHSARREPSVPALARGEGCPHACGQGVEGAPRCARSSAAVASRAPTSGGAGRCRPDDSSDGRSPRCSRRRQSPWPRAAARRATRPAARTRPSPTC